MARLFAALDLCYHCLTRPAVPGTHICAECYRELYPRKEVE